MKELIGYTDPFMSPVTGELASFNQIPQADYGEILIAGSDGRFSPSLSFISLWLRGERERERGERCKSSGRGKGK